MAEREKIHNFVDVCLPTNESESALFVFRGNCGSWTCFSFQSFIPRFMGCSVFWIERASLPSASHTSTVMMGPDLNRISPSFLLCHTNSFTVSRSPSSLMWVPLNSARKWKNSIWAKQCGTLLLNVDNEKWISFSICAHRRSIWESSSLLCVRTNLHDVCCSTVSNCWKLWYFIRESVRLDLVKWAVSTLNWTKIYKWTSHTTELSQSVMNTHHINSASCWWFAERKIIRVIIQTLSCVGAKSE